MNFHIKELHLSFKKGKETVQFADFTYFYGPMGAGKSTIARLVDFCLGGILGEGERSKRCKIKLVLMVIIGMV